MKIYRYALSEETYKYVKEKSKDHKPFDHIFGNNLRVVIPLQNEELLEIFSKLEGGETKTKTTYKIDKNHEFAYRWLVDKNGDITLDPRPMRIGKVIMKELGEEDANEWSRQVNSKQGEEYSVVLSRSPIDIVRMSDHTGIYSCHSPGGDYFVHAEEEAIEGGAIAYVVKTSDIKNLIMSDPDGADALQNQEIFADRERYVKGIKPVSRLRINRYHEEDDESQELGIPVSRTYGERIAGFYDTVKRWVYEKQGEVVDYENINLRNYVRTGGGYADESDSEIIKDFFGESKGVTGELDHKGGQTRANIFREEIVVIDKKLEKILNHPMISYGAEVDAEYGARIDVYLSVGLSVGFEFDGIVDRFGESWTYSSHILEAIKEKLGLKLMGRGHVEDLYIHSENNKCRFDFRIDVAYDRDISNPDDYESLIEEFADYANEYEEDNERLGEYLKASGIVHPAVQIQQEMYDPYTYLGKDRPIVSVPMFYRFKEPFNPDDSEQRKRISDWIKNVALKIIRKYMPKRRLGDLTVKTPYDSATRYPFVTIFAKLYKPQDDATIFAAIQKELDVILRNEFEDKSVTLAKQPLSESPNSTVEAVASNWYREAIKVKYW